MQVAKGHVAAALRECACLGAVWNEDGNMTTLLLTGAAGAIGTTLRSGLRGHDRIRLLDVAPLARERPDEEVIVGDIVDPDVAREATRGIDTVVHFAGVPREAAWEPILRNNIAAVYNLFEAARENGVRRMILASSNHVIGYHPVEREVDTGMPPRPDSRYGVSKVFGEALGRLYADKHGIGVACLRIGSFRPRPENARQLATWISPRDMTQLVQRCIDAPDFHFITLYGVSNNASCRWLSSAENRLVGYVPQDDAQAFAAEFENAPLAEGPAARFHGGAFCAFEFSGDMDAVD